MKIVFDFKIFFSTKIWGSISLFFNLFEHINKKDNLDNAYIFKPIYYNEYLKILNLK